MALSFPTFSDAIQAVVWELSQVPGTSVQTYSEDIMGRYIQRAFNQIFDKMWWPIYSSWITVTLDGTIGIPNADVTDDVKRIQDIAVMYLGDTETKVLGLPVTLNPNTVAGTQAKYFTSYNDDVDRLFRVYPAESTGDLDLYVRTKPDDFTTDDEIRLDFDSVVLRAAWIYATQDAANMEQAALFKADFLDRISQVATDIMKVSPVPLNPGVGSQMTEWQ
jgi:hypothetical protein